MTMYVVKTNQDLYIQAWFTVVYGRSVVAPYDDRLNVISHEWKQGRPPRSYAEYQPALESLWATTDEKILSYSSALNPKQFDLDLYTRRVDWCDIGLIVTRELKKLPVSEFTLVNLVHGDATFSNAVIDFSGKPSMIDPGFHRGLCCKELDEAKVLQSYTGWDYVRHRMRAPIVEDSDPFVIRPVHKLLLITHYLRLLQHPHPTDAYEHAHKTIWKSLESLGL